MLDDDAYLHWLDQCGFSDPARTLLTDIRRSPPVRRTASGRGNIHGRYPSRKMRRTIQFESHTELGAIYLMEHDPGVLEYWDQPTRLKLHYRGPSGRQVTNWHPPDFLVLRQEGASFDEWKLEEELARLVKEHSDRYQRHLSGGYRSAPGETAAEALGLLYRVRSSRELSAVFIQNLMFLEDYWVTPLVVDEFHRHLLQERVAAQPGVRLAEILEPKGEITADMVYALIASDALYADLTAFPLGEHQEVRLFLDAAAAASLPHLSFPSTPALLHTSLAFGGRIYVLAELNSHSALLQGEFGEPISLPRAFFHRLIEHGAICPATSLDADPTRLERRKILNQAGPEAIKVADTRLIAVQALLYGSPEDLVVTVSARTLRRWKAQYQEALVQYGSGYLGLLPQTSKRGNRTPKSDPVARELLEKVIKQDYADARQREKTTVYQGYVRACEKRGVAPLTLRTFYRHLGKAATTEIETQRRGTRATYPEQLPYPYLEYHTPVHGDRPFAIVHLDHTLLDIELVAQASGRNLGRPWATFLMDAFSRRVLAVYLTFDPPSYRSCMMSMRICVKRFGRLPQSLVVDGGKEFESQYFDHLLVSHHCQKTIRPPAQPRFGAIIERIFGTAHTTFLNNLLGNTQASKVPRTATREVDPRRKACWTLSDLYTYLCEWAYEVYDQMDHPALDQTPRAMFVQGLAKAGERSNRGIAYDDIFLKETMPTSRREVGKIQKGKGIKLFGHYYQNDLFTSRELVGQSVPIRYDPFDIGVLYAFVQNQWLPCQSQFYAQLSGRSERELAIWTRRTAQISESGRREPRSLSGAPCDVSRESRGTPGMVAATAERSGEPSHPGYACFGIARRWTSQTLSGRAISGEPGRSANLWGVSLMPRKSIPPSEPLPEALQERLEVFKKYTVEHAMLTRKDDELTQRIWEPGGFAFVLLSGPTGVGKSELSRVVTHRMQTRAQVITLGERLPLPVILVETPAPFTYREWYERVLRALDEPFIEEVIYREVGTSLNGKKATTGRGRASTKPLDEAPELRWAVEKALAKRRVLAIFFDEAQHLMANGETEDLKRCWDWLKSLSNTTGVLFVLAGPYPLLKFRRVSSQAARRSTDVHFPRYQLENPEDCSAFQGVLLALLKQACWAVSGREAKKTELQTLMDHWPLFYRGCLGCVGVLKDWLIRTASAALRKGDAKLTLERVREQELVEASLADMAADIVSGEQQVALTGGDRSQLNSLLQMEGEVAAPTETSAVEAKPTRTKRTSTKPGTRKPKRDPVGDQTPGSSTHT